MSNKKYQLSVLSVFFSLHLFAVSAIQCLFLYGQ